MHRPGKRIAEMLSDGKTYREIIDALGVSASTIAYHAKKLGKSRFSFERKTYDWEAIQIFFDSGRTFRDVTERFGVNYQSIRDATARGQFDPRTGCPVRKQKLKCTRVQDQKEGRGRRPTLPIDSVLREGSRHSTCVVREIVLRNNLLSYRCSAPECLLGTTPPMWNGAEIVLHLDHRNGISNDHRLENLRWLCPNCHSQTPTYCGRNRNPRRKIVDRISTH